VSWPPRSTMLLAWYSHLAYSLKNVPGGNTVSQTDILKT
jgi:hypothetical protein